jgi:hypothetical protein
MKETLDEAANRVYPDTGYKDEIYGDIGEVFREKWIEGAKWQAERMYSEEDMIAFAKYCNLKDDLSVRELLTIWFDQFKKK